MYRAAHGKMIFTCLLYTSYIENPDKTDEKMLVSSFACAYETADIEFELLLSQAMEKGNNLAHHLIQSFAPDETTPEQARCV